MIARDQNNDRELVENFEKEIDEIFNAIEKMSKSVSEMNELKNVGLYVTFKNNQFRLPDNTITVDQFLKIEKLAKLSLNFLTKVMEFAESKGGFSEFERLIKEETEN
jgi:Asp-tRNA(Asn)/Glu-tRNA(Gln) amidotransferase C subunit